MKKCKDCGKVKEDGDFFKDARAKSGLYTYCKECFRKRIKSSENNHSERFREYQREYQRKYHSSYQISKKEKPKYLCRKKTEWLVRSGKIKKENCRLCGNQKSEAHHEDYSKPLEIQWLCKKHHAEADVRRRNLTKVLSTSRIY